MIEPHILPYMEQADCLMVDGTFWRNDEMAVAGLGQKLASDMGHLPQSGDDGMLSVLAAMPRSPENTDTYQQFEPDPR